MGSKQKTRSGSYALEIGKGILLAVLIATLSAGVYAFLIHRGTAPEGSTTIWSFATLAVATLLSCLISSGGIGEKCAVVCGITAAAFAFVLLAIGILFFDGGVQGLGGNIAAIAVGGLAACLLKAKKPSSKVKFKKRSR